MKRFRVYFADEPQSIIITSQTDLEALGIAMASFRDKIGSITVEEDETLPSNFAPIPNTNRELGEDGFPLVAAGFRDFGVKRLSRHKGRLGVELAYEEVHQHKFICLDLADNATSKLKVGKEINLRLYWNNSSADAIEWWEFTTKGGKVYKVDWNSRSEINLDRK